MAGHRPKDVLKKLAVVVRDKEIKALAVAAPFYHAGSTRKKSSPKKEE